MFDLGDGNPSGAARLAALQVLLAVIRDQRSLTDALADSLPELPLAERGLTQELAYGVMRWLPRLQAWRDALVSKPLRRRDEDISCILLLGLYQLAETRIPPHAAVHETVALARSTGKRWSAGLVNAVLRRFQADQQAICERAAAQPAARHAHPDWLLRRFRQAWPTDWEALCDAGNARPPMTLRVNRRHGDRGKYLAQLEADGLAARAHPHATDAIVLDAPVAVERLPGFADGLVSVQDAAGQLAADLLALAPGQRVLDLCAAPGSKTCHMLEREPRLAAVTAVDVDARRLESLTQNLERLQLRAELVVGDGADPDSWWDGRPYDRVLLDAPCSATGVIRRHPDIKSLRRDDDISMLTDTQLKLLRAVWPLLQRGGMLVYSTCSVLPEENAGVVGRFITARTDVFESPIEQSWGLPQAHGRQILTGMDGMDGFYYAVLRKG
ncbi:16S rRNA (cytosine(967)-C(5))-methyltransferase RsmB [Natronocella acetinitrilica]|uniref:16S rRNA (cytosine(967)-C(5))-methyltransferase RsmB n=1 Tax=Natronocella acetinitrilica TaxID=414046 RepID=UPI00209F0741